MRADELEQLERGADELGIALSNSQKEMFAAYSQELLTWNQRVNLISKRDETRIVTRHFLDSLTGLSHIPPKKGPKVADVGAGAGFPGLPLKIVRHDMLLTLLESKRRKVLFLRHLIEKLRLDRTQVVLGRAEEVGPGLDSFDVVLSRGIAGLPRLLPICFPLLRNGGTLIAYKGGGIAKEVAEARSVLEELGGGFIEVNSVALPILGRARTIILVRKQSTKWMVK